MTGKRKKPLPGKVDACAYNDHTWVKKGMRTKFYIKIYHFSFKISSWLWDNKHTLDTQGFLYKKLSKEDMKPSIYLIHLAPL